MTFDEWKQAAGDGMTRVTFLNWAAAAKKLPPGDRVRAVKVLQGVALKTAADLEQLKRGA